MTAAARWRRRTPTWSSTPRWWRSSATRGCGPTAGTLTADLRLALASVERARRNARTQVADHRRLLTLMRAGDGDAAVAELEAHLGAAATSVAERVTRG